MKRRATRGRSHQVEDLITIEVPPEVVELTNKVLDSTPRTQPRGNRAGEPIRRDLGLLAGRLEGILNLRTPGITPETVALAWKLYLDSAPNTVKAPQYFFGDAKDQDPNAANWFHWARVAHRKLSGTASVTSPPTPETQHFGEPARVGVDAVKPDDQ